MRVIFSYKNYGTGGEDPITGQCFYWLHQLVESAEFEQVWIKTKIFYQEVD